MAYEPEFASVLRVMTRDGNTLSTQIRQAWDSGDLRTLVKNNPAVSTGAHISILGHVTKESYCVTLRTSKLPTGSGIGSCGFVP